MVQLPSKLDSLCTILPRLPTRSELVALKLKCKAHQCWLKANDPLYADGDVNFDWADHALGDDCDLFVGLVRQPEATNSHACKTSNRNLVPQDLVQDNIASLGDNIVQCDLGLTAYGEVLLMS